MKFKKGLKMSLLSVIMVVTLMAGLMPGILPAATAADADAIQTVFFYVRDSSNRNVLAYAATLDELDTYLARGANDPAGVKTAPFDISYTDNLPAACYGEGYGFTLPELVAYISANTSVSEFSNNLTYSGGDILSVRTVDSGAYSENYTYDSLYGVARYYFPGIYDADIGWREDFWADNQWETNGGLADNGFLTASPNDPRYYSDNKNAVFATGIPTPVVLQIDSNTGRIREQTGDFSSYNNPSALQAWYNTNGGDMTGYWSGNGLLNTGSALRLSIPQTEQVLRTGQRTAMNNRYWVYDIMLSMTNRPVVSAGAVSTPSYTASVDGGKLTLTLSAGDGAAIYHSISGNSVASAQAAAPYIPYTGPIVLDLEGRNLATQPLQFLVRAVKEGYTDAGNQRLTVNGPTATDPDPSELAFIATAGTGQQVGEPFSVSVSLCADAEFTLYGAQVTMKVAADEFVVGEITHQPGWSPGSSNAGGYTYITFARLDPSGAAMDASNSVASVQLTPIKAGSLTISWENAIATGINADYEDVAVPPDIVITAIASSYFVLGDVDGDGYITMTDATMVARAVAGTTTLSSAQIAAADVDGDGSVTMADATMIARAVAGSIVIGGG